MRVNGDISNMRLFKLINVETAVVVIIFTCSAAVGWSQLTNEIAQVKKENAVALKDNHQTRNHITSINLKLMEISTVQSAQASNMGELKSDMRAIRRLMEQQQYHIVERQTKPKWDN